MKFLRVPLLLFALPAAWVWFLPIQGWQEFMLFNRAGLAGGEIWRLWTGHWVHFSATHLGWNMAVLLAAGAWLEQAQPGRLLCFTLFGTPLISLVLLVGEPALHAYGGLSAIATGIVVLLALTQLERALSGRLFWLVLLILVVGKSAYDATQVTALFSRFDSSLIRPSVLAHLAGVMVAVIYYVSGKLLRLSWTTVPQTSSSNLPAT